MKRFYQVAICYVLLLVITFSAGVCISAETVEKAIALNSVDVVVNRRTIKETNIVYEDRTYVPLRAVFEAIGCKVEYDDETQTAMITGKVIVRDELIKSYNTYEEEYEALKAQYDILIASEQAKGNKAGVDALENEFKSKDKDLKQKYETISNAVAPEPVYQTQEIELGAITVLVNGVKIEETNILFKDRTFVPLRAISDSIGCKVDWEEFSRTAYITGELIQESQPVEEVYTSFEEEYAQLKALYDKRIAEQIALGEHAKTIKTPQDENVDEVIEPGEPTPQITEVDPQIYFNEAENLKEEFNRKVNALKQKYNVSE